MKRMPGTAHQNIAVDMVFRNRVGLYQTACWGSELQYENGRLAVTSLDVKQKSALNLGS